MGVVTGVAAVIAPALSDTDALLAYLKASPSPYHCVAETSRILDEHGIEPAPRRGMAWKTFLQAHWEVIAAADML